MPVNHPETLNALWRGIAMGLETIGVLVIVLGALGTTVVFIRSSFQGGSLRPAFPRFRSDFGRAILLGLEFLVAADIVGTVAIGPTLQDLSVLGLLVLIRTFLSFALEVEITGTLPWRAGDAAPKEE
ncbi:MAG: DUF1622 domain-containing protein [Desulfobaccales bacterium]